jgi:methylmalonyl-CoA mutase
MVPVSLAASDQPAAARALLARWDDAGVPAGVRRGCLGLDPLGRLARTGHLADLAVAVEVANRAMATAPGSRPFVADGTVFHEAGATDVQELAWTTVVGVEYVRALVSSGVDPSTAFAAIEFRWAATDDQFGTVAKLRAARRLWARVAELAGVSGSGGQHQHADSSRAMLTRYDPWVNALRSTVACFAAGVGGATAVTVRPHDELDATGGSAVGRRLARNTQSILLMESSLDRVVDMAGGSWYVETLTAQLASHGWTAMQEVESAGGVEAALRSNMLQDRIDMAVVARRREVATRVRPLTGVTEFPDAGEVRPPKADSGKPRRSGTSAFRPLVPQRLSDDVEALRARADARAAGTGHRPTVFLAVLGTEAESTPRVTFARNFFAVAGVATTTGAVPDYEPSASPVACLCSSDATYRDAAAEATSTLRAAGATSVVLAGRGLDIDGVDQEIGLGTDVVTVLGAVLDWLEVPS